MIAGVTLLLVCLLSAAGALYCLRRIEPVAALLAAGLAALLAVGLWKFPLRVPFWLAGRPVLLSHRLVWEDLSLQISPATQALLVFLLSTGAVTFVLAWRTYQGRTFYPFGLTLLALWAVAALMEPLIWAPFAIAASAMLAAFLIQAGKAGQTRGAWRQLLFPTLAVPPFLVAGWYIDQGVLNPDDPMPHHIAGWLLVVGFILLLQPVPLHVATPAVAEQAPPMVAAFLWIGRQTTVLFLLQRFLISYPWLAAAIDSAQWLLWLGVLTALIGGILAAIQESLGRFLGYASLYDYGVLLVAMGLRGTAGLPTVIWLLLTRSIAVLTLAMGIAVVRHHMEGDRLEQVAGAASRLPWSVIALIVGGFALVGMPLTAQFASRWAVWQLVTEIDSRWAVFLLCGACGVLIGTVRMGRACFGRLSGSPVEREPLSLALLAFGLVLGNVLLGLFPQFLTEPVAAVILPLSTFGP